MYTELKSKEVKCRKEHKCGWCNEHIYPKETAWYRVFIFDGDFVCEHQHLECKEALERSLIYNDEGYCMGAQQRGVCLDCSMDGIDPAHTECSIGT